MVERRSPKPDVVGSSPSWPAIFTAIKRVDVKKAINYLGEVKAELKKVNWPTRQETINSTYIVLAVVGVVSVFLAMVDGVLAWLVREIFS